MSKNVDRYKPLLKLAEKAAIAAGDYLCKYRNHLKIITAKMAHDVKLKADHESEKIIINILSTTNFPILSEEAGLIPSNQNTVLRWIVDPLDGTVNYLEGLPICCVSIGLWEGDHPLLGVVYDFCHEKIYKGIVGGGAWLNNKPICIKQERSLNQSILCTGFPVSMDFSSTSLKTFIKQIKYFKKVRLLGSAAMSLAFVASGCADVYYEQKIKIWDIAGGLALVKAAGGVVHIQKQSSENIINAYAGTGWLIKNL
jgi:myo-inositol-1(or 4)-monophosphatase